MATRGINYTGAKSLTSGVVISDTHKNLTPNQDSTIGRTKFKTTLAGTTVNITGTAFPTVSNLYTNLAMNANVAYTPNCPLVATNPSGVFPGTPVNVVLTVIASAATVNTTFAIIGMLGDSPVTEITSPVNIPAQPANPNVITSTKVFSKVISISTIAAGVILNATTSQAYPNKNAPQLGAALDINSDSGAVVLPRLSQKQILSLDTMYTDSKVVGYQPDLTQSTYMSTMRFPNSYFTPDGAQVFNKTTSNFSQKKGGRWTNLYSEDPMREESSRVTMTFDNVALTNLNGTAAGNAIGILPAQTPIASVILSTANPTNIDQVLLSKIDLEGISGRLSFLSPTVTGAVGAVNIEGFYNGQYRFEQLVVQNNNIPTITQFPYSYIQSITVNAVTTIGTLSIATHRPSPSQVIVPVRAMISIMPTNTAYASAATDGIYSICSIPFSATPATLAQSALMSFTVPTFLAASTANQLGCVPLVPFSRSNTCFYSSTALYLQKTAGTSLTAGSGNVTLTMDYYIVQ